MNKALGSGSYQLKDVVIQNTGSREKRNCFVTGSKECRRMKQSIGAQNCREKEYLICGGGGYKNQWRFKTGRCKKCFRAWAWRPFTTQQP